MVAAGLQPGKEGGRSVSNKDNINMKFLMIFGAIQEIRFIEELIANQIILLTKFLL